jgi:hypothetical protein
MEFISRRTPPAVGGRCPVTEQNVLRFGRDDVLWELTRDEFLGARKWQSLRKISFSISFWFPVAFECFKVPVRGFGMIFPVTRIGTASRISFRDDWHYLKANRSHFGFLKGQPELQRESTSVI